MTRWLAGLAVRVLHCRWLLCYLPARVQKQLTCSVDAVHVAQLLSRGSRPLELSLPASQRRRCGRRAGLHGAPALQQQFAGLCFKNAANVAINFQRLCDKFLGASESGSGSGGAGGDSTRQLGRGVALTDVLQLARIFSGARARSSSTSSSSSSSSDDGGGEPLEPRVRQRDIYWEFLEHGDGCCLNIPPSTRDATTASGSKKGEAGDAAAIDHRANGDYNDDDDDDDDDDGDDDDDHDYDVRYFTLASLHATVQKFVRRWASMAPSSAVNVAARDLTSADLGDALENGVATIGEDDADHDNDDDGHSRTRSRGKRRRRRRSRRRLRCLLLGRLRPLKAVGREGYICTGAVPTLFALEDATGTAVISAPDIPTCLLSGRGVGDSGVAFPYVYVACSDFTATVDLLTSARAATLDVVAGVHYRMVLSVSSVCADAMWWVRGNPRFLPLSQCGANTPVHYDDRRPSSKAPRTSGRGAKIAHHHQPERHNHDDDGGSGDYIEIVVLKRLPVSLRPGPMYAAQPRAYHMESRCWARVVACSSTQCRSRLLLQEQRRREIGDPRTIAQGGKVLDVELYFSSTHCPDPTDRMGGLCAVSYTHLTLPTIYSV